MSSTPTKFLLNERWRIHNGMRDTQRHATRLDAGVTVRRTSDDEGRNGLRHRNGSRHEGLVHIEHERHDEGKVRELVQRLSWVHAYQWAFASVHMPTNERTNQGWNERATQRTRVYATYPVGDVVRALQSHAGRHGSPHAKQTRRKVRHYTNTRSYVHPSIIQYSTQLRWPAHLLARETFFLDVGELLLANDIREYQALDAAEQRQQAHDEQPPTQCLE